MKKEKNTKDIAGISNPRDGFQQVDVSGDIFKQIFRYSIFPIIVHDMDMQIIEANDSAIEEFGFSGNEFLKKKHI